MSSRRGSKRTKLLTTGDMARLSGNTLRTVRFYEESGHLTPNERTEGGHRLFAPRELDKLNLVTALRTAGLSLDDIRTMLEAKRKAPTGGAAAEALLGSLDAQIASLQSRVDLLAQLRDELTAARAHLARCQGCKDRVRFPDECGSCEVMSEHVAITNAVSVLWHVDRGSNS